MQHLNIALGLLSGLGTAADMTTDAQIAAYALENGAEIASNDSDFDRFPGVRRINPIV